MLEKLAMASLASNGLPGAGRSSSGSRGCYWWLPFLGAMLQGVAQCQQSAPHAAVVDIRVKLPRVQGASAEFVVAAMRSAFEDEGSKAVVLLINSPGAARCRRASSMTKLPASGQTQQAGVRGGGRNLCLGGLLHCCRCR